jgi:hypothetical protein
MGSKIAEKFEKGRENMKPKKRLPAEEYFNTGATRPVSIRKLQLMKLKETILKFEKISTPR